MASILSTVTSAVTGALSSLPSPDQIVEAERMQLLGVLDQLRAALEPPIISVQKLCFSAHAITATKIAMGMGVFDALAATGGEEISAADLHAKTKGDLQLLVRVMRILSTNDMVKEVRKEVYKPLPLSMMFPTGAPPGDAITHFYLHLKASAKLYDFFEKTGFKNPGDAYDGPFQYGLDTDKHYFDWLNDHPPDQKAFNSVMTMGRAFRGEEWFEYYPVEEKLQTSPEKTVFIDIGGGVGHDIAEVRNKFPHLPGKMVLQDLPQVIDDISTPLPAGVEAVKYDMFTPQPVKGAKAYYMRTVLHDWPDKQALQALGNIRDAMDAHSVLLINENTLPDEQAPAYSATMDLSMMLCFASLERTEQQWLDLLEEAGFKVVKVWKPAAQAVGSNALFEAVLK